MTRPAAGNPDFDPIHAICVRLRGKPCELCQEYYNDPNYGECKRGCRALAEETANIAKHGNPWGSDQTAEHIAAWQARFNRE